jgi:hypothetical protein
MMLAKAWPIKTRPIAASRPGRVFFGRRARHELPGLHPNIRIAQNKTPGSFPPGVLSELSGDLCYQVRCARNMTVQMF